MRLRKHRACRDHSVVDMVTVRVVDSTAGNSKGQNQIVSEHPAIREWFLAQLLTVIVLALAVSALMLANMKIAAQILVAFSPLLLAVGYPFVAVLRGRDLGNSFLICWVSLVGWQFVFSLVLPIIAVQISRELAHEISFYWVAEPPAVCALLFMGAFPAGVTVLLALLLRQFIHLFRRGQGVRKT